MGVSAGLRGVRLTVTPRGSTYITAGGHGFYYREIISTGTNHDVDRLLAHPPPVPTAPVQPNEIQSAGVADLVDSSSEALVGQLNKRASMFNPAWLLYLAALVAAFIGAAMPQHQLPTAADPIFDRPESYDLFVGHYGYPNSVLASNPLSMVPVRKASYKAAKVEIVFVPESCGDAYGKVREVLQNQQQRPALVKQEIRKLRPCTERANENWIPIDFFGLDDNDSTSESYVKSSLAAGIRLDRAPVLDSDERVAQTTASGSGPAPKPQNQGKQVWAASETVLAPIRAENKRNTAALYRHTYTGYLLVTGSLGIFVAAVIVHKKNAEKRTSRLFYELNESEGQKYSLIQQAQDHLSRAHQVWRIEANSPTGDWKRNAGASSLVRRVSIRLGYANPPRVECNVKVPFIALGQSTLHLMPDLILCCERGRYGAISYKDFQVRQGSTRFIESGFVPADATEVDKTWRYVRADGGPDRRFNNNVQLPVLQYGTLAFQSSTGLIIHLQTSNVDASAAFANCWRKLHDRSTGIGGRQTTSNSRAEAVPPAEAAARKILGVTDTANTDEVSASYRRLAQMYHPDKVEGLGPEFRVLADRRMREINAAYELLKM